VDPGLPDRIAAAKYLEDQGRHYSFWLLDQQKPVAGHTFIRHRNDLVWQVTYRDPAYDRHGVGTHLMDLIFSWGVQAGFERIDMGGQHDYKIRWAPQEGERGWFNICPEPLFRAKQATRLVRSAYQSIANSTHSR
jgi:CelD/BcsL family acetyltransferase involved in cellulose biosynthesis